MPTRYLKPGICDSEAIDKCSALAEILFYRLLVNVDDFGRLDARPAVVRSKCFPLKDSINNNETLNLLIELQKNGLIIIYKSNGSDYLQLLKWDNNPRAKESKCPQFDNSCIQMYTDVCDPRTNLPGTGTGTGTKTETVKPEPELKPEQETVISGGGLKPRPPNPKKSTKEKEPSLIKETWEAYSFAYERRHKAKPVRNATVNGQLTQFVKRIGADESPRVAEFYVYHNNQFYVQKMHSVGLLLADAEKLRTEWITNTRMTTTQARQADQTQAIGNVFTKLIAEAEEADQTQMESNVFTKFI